MRNKHGEVCDFAFSLTSADPLSIALEGEDGFVVTMPPDATQLQRVYMTSRPQDHAAQTARSAFRFWVEDTASGERIYQDTIFNGQESFDARTGTAG